MKPDRIKNSELDSLIHNALKSSNKLIIPQDVSEKLVRNLEKKVLFWNLMLEFIYKIGLVLGSLALLTGIFVWINGRIVFSSMYAIFADNWQLVTLLLFTGFITVLIDQVGLRFYHAFNKEQI